MLTAILTDSLSIKKENIAKQIFEELLVYSMQSSYQDVYSKYITLASINQYKCQRLLLIFNTFSAAWTFHSDRFDNFVRRNVIMKCFVISFV